GVVEGVYGFVWFDVTFAGSADHAGPTPMHLRNDALVATSDVVEGVRRIAGAEGEDLVGTVGSLDVSPNSINVIPETVDFTVDFRSYDDETVDRAADRIRAEIEHAAAREDVEASHEVIMRIESQAFDDGCIGTVATAADDIGADYTRLISGAGHDASYLNGVCPTAMVFVPSVGGVSHTEDEFTEWEDVVTGTEVLYRVVLEKANEPGDGTEVER
ncbi:MAG: M20/M25/M40 family metallo-hydrolase, partial [Halorhabdus sp.]